MSKIIPIEATAGDLCPNCNEGILLSAGEFDDPDTPNLIVVHCPFCHGGFIARAAENWIVFGCSALAFIAIVAGTLWIMWIIMTMD